MNRKSTDRFGPRISWQSMWDLVVREQLAELSEGSAVSTIRCRVNLLFMSVYLC